MSLAERLKKKPVKVENVTVDGDRYVVTGKSKLDKGKIYASCRRKDGTLDLDKLESALLAACVTDEENSSAPVDVWESASSHITGPLVAAVLSVCGMDKDDLKRDDPKDSGSTEN